MARNYHSGKDDDKDKSKREKMLDILQSNYRFWVKKFGEERALDELEKESTEYLTKGFIEWPISNDEKNYIRGIERKVNSTMNLQTDVKRNPDKQMRSGEYGKQANERSAGVLSANPQKELEPKPSEQFMNKAPKQKEKETHKKSLEEIEAELNAAEDKDINELLDEKFSKIKKTRRQFR